MKLKSQYNYAVIGSGLGLGKRYTFHSDRIDFLEGSAAAEGVTVALYNSDRGTLISGRIFDVAYCNEKGGFTWHFDVPEQEEGQIQLLLYAGMPGQTQGVELTCRNASLTLEE